MFRSCLISLVLIAAVSCIVVIDRADAVPVTSGLQLWLDASDTSTVEDFEGDNPGDAGFSGNVRKWCDKSGSGYVADAGGAHAATYETNGLTGSAPVLRFIGNNARRMNISSFNFGGDATIFAVFKTDIAGGNRQILNTNGSGSGGGNYMLEFPTNQFQGRVYTGSNTGIVNGSVNTTDSYIGAYEFQNNTTAGAELFIDGASQGTANTSNVAAATTTASVGNHPTGSVAFDGDLAELLAYNRVLNAADHNRVGYYLEQKYALDTAYDPDVIGVNFYRSSSAVWTQLGATDQAGEVAADNWNNIDIDPSRSFSAVALQDATGSATTVTIGSTVSPGYDGNNGVGNTTPDHKMMNGSLYYDNGDGTDTGTITISGLGGLAPSYDLYLYFETNENDRDHTFTVTGPHSESGLDGATFNGTFIEATGSGVNANYMVFEGLTASTLTIDATATNGRAGLAGIQIVGIPEPSALLLAAIGLVGLLACRRRRRAA